MRSSERVAIRENLVELSSLRRDEEPSGTEKSKTKQKTRTTRPCWEPGYYNPTVYVSLLSEPFGFNCVYFSIQTETEVNPQRVKTTRFELKCAAREEEGLSCVLVGWEHARVCMTNSQCYYTGNGSASHVHILVVCSLSR
jgi:hypothetical protein